LHDDANTMRQVISAAGLSAAHADRIVQHALMLNVWRVIWGSDLSVLDQRDFTRICSVEGAEHLYAAQRAGHGVICLHHHSLFVPAFSTWLASRNMPYGAGISSQLWREREDARLAVVNVEQLRAAAAALREGGLAHVGADGRKGRQSAVMPFLTRQRTFSPSFVELARSTGAAVITVAVAVDQAGQLSIVIGAPFERGAADTDDERERRWMGQYVAHLEEQWRTQTANVGRFHLRLFLDLPARNQA
jgi:lauroyl/myristoyl acyltransferase